jgi:hypothetical protein
MFNQIESFQMYITTTRPKPQVSTIAQIIPGTYCILLVTFYEGDDIFSYLKRFPKILIYVQIGSFRKWFLWKKLMYMYILIHTKICTYLQTVHAIPVWKRRRKITYSAVGRLSSSSSPPPRRGKPWRSVMHKSRAKHLENLSHFEVRNSWGKWVIN